MLYLTCTTITSIDLAHYGVSRAKDWVSVKCGTRSKTAKRVCTILKHIEILPAKIPVIMNGTGRIGVNAVDKKPYLDE